METVICPNCDITLGENESACPSCGWVNNNEVDNTEAISLLFASDDDADGENIIKGTGAISPEQIAAFQSGQAIEFLPGSDEINESDDIKDFFNITDIPNTPNIPNTADVPDEDGFHIPDIGDMSGEIPDEEENGEEDSKKKKETKSKPAFLRIIFTALIAVIAFALGFTGFYLYDMLQNTKGVYQIGYDAVTVVSAKAPYGSEFKATDIYVKQGAEITHCIVYGELISSVMEREVTYYRLEINNLNRENTILYYAFDETEYNRLKNGSDEDKIKASIMKSYYDAYLRYVGEIKSGGCGWETANADYINFMLGKDNN